jgi:hypothetical protein
MTTMELVLSGAILVLLLPDPSAAQTGRTGPTSPASARRAETYESAAVDSNGELLIIASDYRRIVIRKKGEQSSFQKPIVSPDRSAVGAQAEYPNCCTSYDIPLQLVVYANGKEHRFRGNGLPIFQWHFADHGTRVAFGQEPVHFGCSIHYELRDIRSERLIHSADVPEPCGQSPDPPTVTMPNWVSDLRAAAK